MLYVNVKIPPTETGSKNLILLRQPVHQFPASVFTRQIIYTFFNCTDTAAITTFLLYYASLPIPKYAYYTEITPNSQTYLCQNQFPSASSNETLPLTFLKAPFVALRYNL